MGGNGTKKGKGNVSDDLKKKVLNIFKEAPSRPFNYKQIAHQLNIRDAKEKRALIHLLRELSRENFLQEEKKGSYIAKTAPAYLEGVIEITASGSAFVIVPDRADDIYIRPKWVKTALNGDLVKVHLFAQRKGKRPEGEIIEVIKRARDTFVGILKVEQRFAFLVPDSSRMTVDIFIPLENLNGGRNGQKAVAKITGWPDVSMNPVGEITEVIGYPGESKVERHSILAEFGFPTRFNDAVEQEAARIPDEIGSQDLAERRDFRKVTTFTIDPADAKDFDDALSITPAGTDTWEVGIHIADVSHYVRPGSLLDEEAFRRGTSVYLADAVVPMLPERLSNGICSLRPEEEKLCYAAVFEINGQGVITKSWIGRTIICSDKRFTYEEAQQVLESGKGPFSDELLQLNRLAKLLRRQRFDKGAIAFESIETRFRFDEKGHPVEVYIKESKDSNHLIEEFMLLANRHVAEYAGKQLRKPFVYRIHDSPRAEKLDIFSSFISRFGYKINTRSRKELSRSLNDLMKKIKGSNEENIIEQLSIRTMEKAIYTTENIGHYGLAFPYYSHFTSPIRRYPDVMVHRLLTQYLAGKGGKADGNLESQCRHASEMERKAVSAERASIKYMQVHYLADKVGQVYEGIISGVTEWGLYVEILENKCEGMVRLRDMGDDYYVFEEENFCVAGYRTGQKYRLGDRVMIQVKKADLVKKQLDFAFVGQAGKGAEGRRQ